MMHRQSLLQGVPAGQAACSIRVCWGSYPLAAPPWCRLDCRMCVQSRMWRSSERVHRIICMRCATSCAILSAADMTPASMGPFKAVTAGMIASAWAGASDPCAPAAKDYQGLLSLMEEACRWVLKTNGMSRLSRPNQRVLSACTHRAILQHL